METFEQIFGINSKEVRKNCVLAPLISRQMRDDFGVLNLKKGVLYNAGIGADFTLIRTHVGASFTGDCVLYLKDTPCERLWLFGSCGLVRQTDSLEVSSLIAPEICYAWESFSEMLANPEKKLISYNPDSGLLNTLPKNILRARLATLGSLYLQEDYRQILLDARLDAVDLECSAFFSAAAKTGKKAAALFYASDIISEQPFYINPDFNQISKINAAIHNGIKTLLSCLNSEI